MKKHLLLSISMIIWAIVGFSQTLPYSDNFDSYSAGSFLAVVNPIWWTTWSNLPSSGEDIQITTAFAHSAPNSGSVDTVGGPTDGLLRLGDKVSGKYELKWWMYIETGKCGYYNIQHMQFPGIEWAFYIFFRTNGTLELKEGGDTITGTYPKDNWFEVRHEINLDDDEIKLYINGALLHTWPFSNWAGAPGGTKQLGSVDFWAGAQTGSDEIPGFYIDDIYYSMTSVGIDEVEKVGVRICPNPVNNTLNVVTSEEPKNITISDARGVIHYRGNKTHVDVSKLEPGMYFVKVETTRGTSNTRFIKN